MIFRKMDKKRVLKQFKFIDKLKGNMRLAAEDWKSDYKTLISTILSARSLDETTIKVCNKLFIKYPNIRELADAKIESVRKIIKPINYYKNKSNSILKCAKILDKIYTGKIPNSYEELIKLPGVGNKTANVFLSELGKHTIGVDTHVYYISRFLGWSNSNKFEDVENDLKNLFPKNYWRMLNPTLVKFGKKYRSRKEKNIILDKIKSIK